MIQVRFLIIYLGLTLEKFPKQFLLGYKNEVFCS